MKKLVLLLAAFSISAMADDRRQGNDYGSPGQLSFEDLKVACQNPAKFHAQVAPSNIQVTCSDVQHRWVPDADGAFEMANSRSVTTAVYSDKYTVAPQSSALVSSNQVASCPQFKEVAETIEVARAVTCDEIVSFNGTGIDFCASAADAVRAANKGAIRMADTGRMISLCGQGRGDYRDDHGQGRGQRGQR